MHNQVRQVIGKSVDNLGKRKHFGWKIRQVNYITNQKSFEPCKGSKEGDGIGIGDEKIRKGVEK